MKAIDTTTLTNGKSIVVYSNKTWKYIVRPAAPATGNTYYNPSQEQNSEPVTTRNTTRSTYTPATASHQCHATTQKGAQCRRMVLNGYNCWQHGG